MIGVAVVFGLIAVFIAQSWINNQADLRVKFLESQKKPLAVQTIVVASRPLRFGAPLDGSNLREVSWPEQALPVGAFAKVADVLTAGRRIVLTAIEENEPILGSKITGPGQRATLSAVLREGMKAVTVRVNDVEGVAGFVLPGDRVDVALTRQNDKTGATTDVVLQNARVLAIDQLADERTDKPSVAKAVTLEVDTASAQKLSLSASIGSLSLMLRKAGEAKAEFTRRITTNDLMITSVPADRQNTNGALATVVVNRAAVRQEYNVPVDSAGPSTVGAAGRQ
jgi:pilus assembly protein CpaB